MGLIDELRQIIAAEMAAEQLAKATENERQETDRDDRVEPAPYRDQDYRQDRY